MTRAVVVRVTERAHDPAFPSWRSLLAFYRAKPKVAVATVALATLPNLLWMVDKLT